jgi:hypothetical protein
MPDGVLHIRDVALVPDILAEVYTRSMDALRCLMRDGDTSFGR